jgi:hypothetical protein
VTEQAKDTIYIDIDDEITSIIEKVSASKNKIVALVLPKRATVLQSIVNMKLLKRRADNVGKRVVLITSEAGILPLAGAVGIYTAKTLQSKPVIPAPPDVAHEIEQLVEADVPEGGPDADIDGSKSIGELAGIPDEKEETIDVDNDAPAAAAVTKKAKTKKNKDKKLRVPNFDSFRTRLFLGIGLLIVLIGLWYLANSVLPSAKITVSANTTTVNINQPFIADTAVKAVDTTAATPAVPAVLKQFPKTDTATIPATGQKDNGTKAVGAVTLSTSCSPNFVTVPAGSGVSTGGLTFITQSDTTLNNLSNKGGHCVLSGDTNVTAQQNGVNYNIPAGQPFTVAGYSGVSGSNAAAIAGGTSQIVKVVSQSDIDNAKQKLLDNNRDAAKSNLTAQFNNSDIQPILETFASGDPAVTATPAVGTTADNVTVNAVITYTMMGIKKDDLKKLIDASAKKQLDTSKQPISDYGLDKISFQVNDTKSANQATITLQVAATAGVKLNIPDLQRQIAGKKKGDIEQIIGTQPGVKSVDVHYSPFWVNKAPKKTSKITIVVQQAK